MYTMPDKIIKFPTEAMKKNESEINRRKNFSNDENPERHLPGRCTLTITICYSNDTTPLHTLVEHWGVKIHKNTRKDKSPYIHGRH